MNLIRLKYYYYYNYIIFLVQFSLFNLSSCFGWVEIGTWLEGFIIIQHWHRTNVLKNDQINIQEWNNYWYFCQKKYSLTFISQRHYITKPVVTSKEVFKSFLLCRRLILFRLRRDSKKAACTTSSKELWSRKHLIQLTY